MQGQAVPSVAHILPGEYEELGRHIVDLDAEDAEDKSCEPSWAQVSGIQVWSRSYLPIEVPIGVLSGIGSHRGPMGPWAHRGPHRGPRLDKTQASQAPSQPPGRADVSQGRRSYQGARPPRPATQGLDPQPARQPGTGHTGRWIPARPKTTAARAPQGRMAGP